MRSGNLQAGEELIQQREREEKGGNVASVELLPSNEKEGRGKHETARDDSLLTRDVQTVDMTSKFACADEGRTLAKLRVYHI